jgi:AraC-like DNA-binding protein
MLELQTVRRDQGMDWYEDYNGVETSFSIVLVTYGKVVYWIEDEKVIVEKGEMLLLPVGTRYYGKTIPTVFHEKYVVRFNTLANEEAKLPILAGRQRLKSKVGYYELILDLLKVTYTEWIEELPYAAIRGQAKVTELLALWSRELEQSASSLGAKANVERMKTYIAEHYREKITKEQLGACIRVTPNYAATLFSKMTGQTISEYVHSVRIRTAIYMLNESLLTVSEVAAYLGYNDVSYFHKLFKKTTGSTPAQFAHNRPN